MERKGVFGITLILLVVSMLTLTFHVQPVKAEPKTWTVDDDGPADFSKIQDAINAANPGDTMYVHNGTYYENVLINKDNLTLLGEDRKNTIIDGGRTGNVIRAFGGSPPWFVANITISGFTIRNGAGGYYGGGAYVRGKGNTIQNNIIANNSYNGIYLESGGTGNLISGNIITNNSASGILLYYQTSHHVINDNTITRNGWGGILLWGYGNHIVHGNIIENNRGYGGIAGGRPGSNLISENIIKNNGDVKVDEYGNVYDFRFGISVAGSSNIIVGNTITNHSKGIWMSFSDNIIYHNNFISNTNQVSIKEGETNTWDDGCPSGGNYWSDYTLRYPDAQELEIQAYGTHHTTLMHTIKTGILS